jgi:hypothetical protein
MSLQMYFYRKCSWWLWHQCIVLTISRRSGSWFLTTKTLFRIWKQQFPLDKYDRWGTSHTNQPVLSKRPVLSSPFNYWSSRLIPIELKQEKLQLQKFKVPQTLL